MWLPSEEEAVFGATVTDLLAERGAVAATRAGADRAEAWNEALWRDLEQMGVAELLAEGELGAALSVADALGRHPANVPALSTAVLAPALAQSAGFELPSGSTWAVGPFDEAGRLSRSPLTIEPDGRVTGMLPLTLGAAWAEAVITVDADGSSVRAIDLRQEGVRVRPRAALDTTLPFADVEFDSASSRVLAVCTSGVAQRSIAHAEAIGALWLSAGEIGTAQQLLDMAVTYAGQRVQFGMRIGERQAITHKCADLLMLIESARSALWAAVDVDPDGEDWPRAISLLRLASSRAVDAAAQQSFQIHGGIGFTWEHDLHLLFKRAIASRLIFGGDELHRDRLFTTLMEKK
ncbi:hypothetical protein ASD65_13170 [Microbacterium sp. Root61]|uniref:acyl-CoA dehydrogenase family protein n=1 Tax=Microbacterium sp. Root61 TaxID=1736570 RepID=UPI0006F6C621|nr:acyl-CoA dehydrogenase family protein [Microbacterium sp. Root61]KRA25265.1 hypothetical protein ASD65_13170 [Microbacterium sp. Root61]